MQFAGREMFSVAKSYALILLPFAALIGSTMGMVEKSGILWLITYSGLFRHVPLPPTISLSQASGTTHKPRH
jgi:hypothetical protein